MADIIGTLHPEDNQKDNFYPNIQSENIPDSAITPDMLNDEVFNELDSGIQSFKVNVPQGGYVRHSKRVNYSNGSTVYVKIIEAPAGGNVTLAFLNSSGSVVLNQSINNRTYTTYTFTDDVIEAAVYSENAQTVSIIIVPFELLTNLILPYISNIAENIPDSAITPDMLNDEVFNELDSGIQSFKVNVPQGGYVRHSKRVNYSNGSTVYVKILEAPAGGNVTLAFLNSSGSVVLNQLINNRTYTTYTFTDDVIEAAVYSENAQTVSIIIVPFNIEVFQPTYMVSIMYLGDSITRLGIGDTGWIKYFNEIIKNNMIVNTSVGGARLQDVEGTIYDGDPVFENPTNNVLGNQVQKILNNDYPSPDIIIIAIGTNGGLDSEEINYNDIYNNYYDNEGNLIPLNSVDRKTTIGAYRWCNETLHNKYPNAKIFWCAPIQAANSLSNSLLRPIWESNLRKLTNYSGDNIIPTNRCGISSVNEIANGEGRYLTDGIHPNVNGAKLIGYYNASIVEKFIRGIYLYESDSL